MYLEYREKQPLMATLSKRNWDIQNFGSVNLPLVVGKLQNPKTFSQNSGIRVLDMPVKMPKTGLRLPLELEQFREVIQKARQTEQIISNDESNMYCYITVDQKVVQPHVSQRRPGCHSDAFICDSNGRQVDVKKETSHLINKQQGYVERTYLCYDVLPTEFFPGPFLLSSNPNCEEVLQGFDEVAKTQTAITYPAHTLICIDPYDVHRAAINESEEVMNRTFIKIAFSYKQYNRKGNTHNNLFDYNWEMIERNPMQREHRYTQN